MDLDVTGSGWPSGRAVGVGAECAMGVHGLVPADKLIGVRLVVRIILGPPFGYSDPFSQFPGVLLGRTELTPNGRTRSASIQAWCSKVHHGRSCGTSRARQGLVNLRAVGEPPGEPPVHHIKLFAGF